MSTITDLTTTDNGANSMATINTNFDNLNADKSEAGTVEILTNKTIDADSNTISNLETDNLKASAKTGLDTKFVTGSSGTADNLTKWNSDGDMIDAGVEVSIDNTLGGASPVDTKLPTEKATKEYIDGISNAVVELITPTYLISDGLVGYYGFINLGSGSTVVYNWSAPSWMTEITSVKFIIIPDTTETIQYDVDIAYNAIGDLYTDATQQLVDETQAVTLSQLTYLDVTSLFVGVSASDIVGVKFTSNTSDIRVVGMEITYN